MELEQYFKAILRWWWLILLSAGIAAAGSYYFSSQQPRIYQTTATLMVGQVIQQANPTGSDFATTELLAESYAQMAVRQPIMQATVDSLDLKMGWQELKWRVNVYPIARTQLLGITVQDTSPERAVAIADEIAYQLILQSPSSPENEARQERSQFVKKELDDLETKIQTTKTRIEGLETELTTAFSARQIQELQIEISNLESLIKGWQGNYTELLRFFDGGGSPNFLTVIESAQLPTVPISPNIQINVLMAVVVGVTLAVGAALLLEYLDYTVKSADDLSASLNLITLGSINQIKGKDYKSKLITSHDPFSSLAEAYRGLRTNIQFMAVDRPAKSIMVTSPNPGEGKSTTAANLGVTMAHSFLRTVIVDADLRKPDMHRIFGVPNLGGVTNLISSPEVEIDDYLQDTGIENLQIITSGPLPPNPSEMLGSQRMIELLQRLEKVADVIIFDSPPITAVTDAAVLSNRVDGVLLVVQAKRTRRDVTQQAVKRLQQVGANLLGCVLNRVPQTGRNYLAYSTYSHNGRQPAGNLGHGHSTSRHWWQRLNVSK